MNLNKHPEFPLADGIIYLNHAAVAPWPQRTVEAVKAFAQDNGRHGAYRYADWLRAEAKLREQLAHLINAPSPDDIALVKNTSEALSLVAYGLSWQPGDNIVSAKEEFPSNRIPWESLAPLGVEFRQAELSGSSEPEQRLFDLVDVHTRLITISSVQFATGIRLDLARIGEFCRQHRILFCVDAIQSLGAIRFDAQAIRADFVMADGHKWMLGPEGLGVFYTSPEARERLRLTQFGWHMIEEPEPYDNKPWTIARTARRFECGSTNMLGVHALSASLSLLLETGLENVERAVLNRASYLTDRIIDTSTLTLMSPTLDRLRSGIVLFRHNRMGNESVFRHMRAHGVVCAQRAGGIRMSPHFYSTNDMIDEALAILAQLS